MSQPLICYFNPDIIDASKFKYALRPIKTSIDYHQALARLKVIFDAKGESPDGDELEILSILINEYEEDNFPIGLPDLLKL